MTKANVMVPRLPRKMYVVSRRVPKHTAPFVYWPVEGGGGQNLEEEEGFRN